MRTPLTRRTAGAFAALAMCTGLAGALAPPAAAAETIPAFDFSLCPQIPADAVREFWTCNNIVAQSGTFDIGILENSITTPITLVYATGFDPVTLEGKVVFGAFRSNAFRARDGLLTGAYAKPEYAGGLTTENSKINLNIKVRVINPVLPWTCHVGSNSNPIKLQLGVGTTNPPPPNTPISGEPPVSVPNGDIPTIRTTVVDNAFAVPGATGCLTSNWLVNAFAGTPAAAGRNTVIFKTYTSFKTYTELP